MTRKLFYRISPVKKLFGAGATACVGFAAYRFFEQKPFIPSILSTLSEDLDQIKKFKSNQKIAIAMAYAKHGDTETAITMLTELADATHDQKQLAEIYYEMGKGLLRLGKTAEAAQFLTKAVKNDSTLTPIIVVGAGSTGCELAYEFARHDERVLVFEADSSVAKGATNASSSLVWFSAYMAELMNWYDGHVGESAKGIKSHLERSAPEYIETVDINIIVKAPSFFQALCQIATYEAAVSLYYFVVLVNMGFQSYARAPNFTRATHFPEVKQTEDFWGVVKLTEARFVGGDVSRAVASVATTAQELGAGIFCGHRYSGLSVNNDHVMCSVENTQTGEIGQFPAKKIVYAVNAYIENVSQRAFPKISCKSGAHIFIPARLVNMHDRAFAAILKNGRRVFFLREGEGENARIRIGTTEEPGIAQNGATASEYGKEYLLQCVNELLKTKSGLPITVEDILYSTYGTRTVVGDSRKSIVCELSCFEIALLCLKLTPVSPVVLELVNKLTGKYLPPSEKRLVGNNIENPLEFSNNRLHKDFEIFALSGETWNAFRKTHLDIISEYRDAYKRVLELRKQYPDSYQALYKMRYPNFLDNNVEQNAKKSFVAR